MKLTREDALQILDDWVKNDALKYHMYTVEAVVRAYARKFGEDEEKWGLAALLHDADWEKYPDVHPQEIVSKLKEIGEDEEIIQAIASHGNNGEEYGNRFTERTSLLDKVLFACDELTGFIVAVSKVRPEGFSGMNAKSIKKKLKNKAFAAQVSREDINQGAEELGIDLSEHILFVIKALQEFNESNS